MFFVEIVLISTGEVVKRLGPVNERKADKVESGVKINLNHAEYFTRIVSAAEWHAYKDARKYLSMIVPADGNLTR